jgi:NAD-dependent deacetylase
LITQNVDGLHQQAGSPQVIELHGNILRTRCALEGTLVEQWMSTEDIPPRCPNCGGLLRPDVVWFGESLPVDALERAYQAADQCEVFFSIGTSTLVEPAASLPFIALQQGAVVVEINPQSTPLSGSANYVLPGLFSVVLPILVQAVWGG